MIDFEHRFWNKVNILGESDCWEWLGSISKGYGNIRMDGKVQSAHRVSFFMTNKYWPNICRHTCDNPKCVNPNHLLDGNKSDNAIDSVKRLRHYQARKTHCPQDHEYSKDNIYLNKGNRQCIICVSNRQRYSYYKKVYQK